MSVLSSSRCLHVRLSHSYTTTSLRRNSTISAEPSPPRRKGRIPRINPNTQSLLPQEKLRALVSLYHQSDDFITEENLEARVDAAFTARTSSEHGQSINQIPQPKFSELLRNQRSASRMAPWNTEFVTSGATGGQLWSERVLSNRERQVVDALCGTETLRPEGQTLPGYGTLMETRKQRQGC